MSNDHNNNRNKSGNIIIVGNGSQQPKPIHKMPLSRSLTQPQGTIEYVVTANDTITSVAARFHTTPTELARINHSFAQFIFPGQVLYVPKCNPNVSSLSTDSSGSDGCLGRQNSVSNVLPNTPNDPANRTQSPSKNVIATNIESSTSSDNNSPFPGHVERIPVNNEQILTNTNFKINSETTNKKETVAAIDPADRECLERFLKINHVRYITDGQGVVGGVLLVTPNALMFDSNVSDPLVVEHGPELYNVTVPIDLVLKTALYSDIAHMRVKHAPEAVPSVPKPPVYYASDEDTGCIVEENSKNAYAKKKSTFDTIRKVSEEKLETEESLNKSTKLNPKTEISSGSQEKVEDDEFKDAVENLQPTPPQDKTIINNKKSCDEVHKSILNTVSDVDNEEQPETKLPNESCSKVVRQNESTEQSLTSKMQNNQASTEVQVDEDEADDSTRFHDDENSSNSQKRMEDKKIESIDDDQATSIDQSLDIMTSMDDIEFNTSFSTPPQSANECQGLTKKALPCLAKMSLTERHSVPLQAHNKNTEDKQLQSAISTEETCSDPLRQRSTTGENRRGQMLKRLSNPVDTIGNLTKSGISSGINATKSGFNATKTGISKGLNATQSGISTGFNATKSGFTTGLNVTKTGFNKVLSTPKNLMDFSSGLVRDAKGALIKTEDSMGSGSLDQENSASSCGSNQKPTLGYCNMVNTKIDAFENFDKLIPKPARVNKDPPLYLCIRMGKYMKNNLKRNQRFSPTHSFGKNKYEREYWFSVPKDKAKNLYHFFKRWAPDVYGDVYDISGCEKRGLEPLNSDNESDDEDIVDGGSSGSRRQYIRLSSQDKDFSLNQENNASGSGANESNKMNATNRQKFWRRSPLHFLKLVEDHFSTDGLSTDWNISNSSEEHSFAERYNLELSTEPILPELNGNSELLNTDIITNLSKHLPARAESYAWTLIYSTSQHGFSLNTLYREMKQFDSPVLLIIEDTNGAKFGALLSHSLKLSDHFYGTGETFLFTFHPTFECFPWTGENIFFIKGNLDSVSIGAGEGCFGLWLDGDLYHGSSHQCKTFGNRTLSSDEDFVVKSIECWGFI